MKFVPFRKEIKAICNVHTHLFSLLIIENLFKDCTFYNHCSKLSTHPIEHLNENIIRGIREINNQ